MITRLARAKINLGLKILNKREDGFHNIETTLTTITLSDKLLVEETEQNITIHSPGLKIPQEDNLCYRAARLFLTQYKIEKGIKISIQKNIPVGAGLGGGSSDAAATLKGLNQLFNLNLSDENLVDLGRKLGCDVPFFIKGGAAYAKGIGDELKFFKLPKMSLVIYYPGYPISTKWAYEEFDKKVLTPAINLDIIKEDNKKNKKVKTGFGLKNDFEEVVFKAHPDLLDIKAHLLSTGVFMVSLSGSGSCLFAVVEETTREKVIKYLSGIGAIYFEAETV